MSTKKVIHAMYNDDQVLLDAAKTLVAKGIRVRDVFSPFPIHGIDPVIGVKRTRLGVCAFLFGITGTACAIFGIYTLLFWHWPMNIGGKPNFDLHQNIPSFVPIIFEFTVFCAAHGMAITYLLRNRTLPGLPARNPDPRTTDDKFVMEIAMDENSGFSENELLDMVKGTEVEELNEREY